MTSPKLLFVLPLLFACTGAIGDADDNTVAQALPPVPELLPCDGSEPDSRAADPLRRLTRAEYESSLSALLNHFAGERGEEVIDSLASLIEPLPLDQNLTAAGGPEAHDQIYSVHVSSYVDIADAIGRAIEEDAELRVAFGGECAHATPMNQECAEALVQRVGLWAMRRPLSEEETTRFADFAQLETNDQLRRAVSILLVQPQFLYHVEVDGSADEAETYLDLTQYELASRISFYFWHSMPDAELFAAAERGEIRDDVDSWIEYARENEEKTLPVLREFARQWLSFDEMPPVNLSDSVLSSDPRFAALTMELGLEPGDADAFQEAMKAELLALVEEVWGNGGSLGDLFTTDRAFSDDPLLEAIYEPSQDGRLLNRTGILSRAAFLFTGTGESHPIQRGNAVWERFFCTKMVLPDDLEANATTLPEPMEGVTTREQLEVRTGQGTCAGCHTLINPVGFALEQYDAIGRFREVETLYDASHEILSEPTIDPVVLLPSRLGGEEVDGARGLSEAVADSRLASDCFAQRYFAFARGRSARPEEDRPMLCTISETSIEEDSGGLRQMVAEVARSAEFRRHYLPAMEEEESP